MEPVTTILTGIALVKQSVEFIKSNIDTVNDIREIMGMVDDALSGEKQIQEERFGNKSLLSQTKSAANSVIDSKIAQEQLYELSLLIDYRFGNGTWQQIINERAKRLQEEREEEQRIKQERIRKNKAIKQMLMQIGLAVGIVMLLAFAGVLIFTTQAF